MGTVGARTGDRTDQPILARATDINSSIPPSRVQLGGIKNAHIDSSCASCCHNPYLPALSERSTWVKTALLYLSCLSFPPCGIHTCCAGPAAASCASLLASALLCCAHELPQWSCTHSSAHTHPRCTIAAAINSCQFLAELSACSKTVSPCHSSVSFFSPLWRTCCACPAAASCASLLASALLCCATSNRNSAWCTSLWSLRGWRQRFQCQLGLFMGSASTSHPSSWVAA